MKTSSLLFSALMLGIIGGLVGNYLGSLFREGPVREEVRAKSFVLVNDAGNMRGKWAALPNGSAILALFDRAGKQRGQLVVLQDGRPNLTLFDAEGARRGVFGMSPENKAVMSFDPEKCCPDDNPDTPASKLNPKTPNAEKKAPAAPKGPKPPPT